MTDIELRDYQRYAVDFAKNTPYGGVGLFMDMGTGKTLATLKLLEELALANQIQGHILVIGPKTIVKTTWMAEIEKWGFNIRTKSLVIDENGRNLSAKKRKEIIDDIPNQMPTMYFINRDKPLLDLVEKYQHSWPFQTVIIDESQGFASTMTRRNKALVSVRSQIQRIILLSGTPTMEGLQMIFGQMLLIDGGATFGTSYEIFLNTFFEPDENSYITKMRNGRNIGIEATRHLPRQGAEDFIINAIKPSVISVINPDLNLPELLHDPVKITPSPAFQKAYKKFKKEAVLDLIDQDNETWTITAANAAVLRNKLMQFASGTIYVDDKHNFKQTHKLKLEYIDYLLDNIDSPVIIAYKFVAEKKVLLEHLAKRGVKEFDKSAKMTEAWNNKEIPVMLLQPASAAHGLNLQYGGYHLIWHTLPYSGEHYTQANKRLHRPGQTNTVIIHELMLANTYDATQLDRLNGKQVQQQNTLDGLRLEIADALDVDANNIDINHDITENEKPYDTEDRL